MPLLSPKVPILRKIVEIGYKNVICKVICAADYGVPQKRYRVIFIGSLDGMEMDFPKITNEKNEYEPIKKHINCVVYSKP